MTQVYCTSVAYGMVQGILLICMSCHSVIVAATQGTAGIAAMHSASCMMSYTAQQAYRLQGPAACALRVYSSCKANSRVDDLDHNPLGLIKACVGPWDRLSVAIIEVTVDTADLKATATLGSTLLHVWPCRVVGGVWRAKPAGTLCVVCKTATHSFECQLQRHRDGQAFCCCWNVIFNVPV